MGSVLVPTKYGNVSVTIAGDKPSTRELLAINDIRLNPEKYLSAEAVAAGKEKSKGMFEGFDYTTGVQNAGLRAALSLAEKPEEEVTQLARFGLSEGDYTRDPRGRLALTPRGAAKLDIGTDSSPPR